MTQLLLDQLGYGGGAPDLSAVLAEAALVAELLMVAGDEPRTAAEALSRPNAKEWRASID